MNWFFALEGEAPQELWIPVFSRAHAAWLISSAVFCAAVTVWFLREPPARRKQVLKICACAAVGSELLRDVWLLCSGEFAPVYMLPLHLCGAMLFAEFAAVYTEKPFLKELCYCLGLPGALSALITPGVTGFPLWNLMYLQFIFAHTMLLLIPVLLLADGFRPDCRQLPKCFLSLLLLAVFDSLTNFILNSNYLFLRSPSAGSVLELIGNMAGSLYLPAVMGFVWLVWAVFYLPWVLLQKSSRLQTAPQTAAAELPKQRVSALSLFQKIAIAAHIRPRG
ncbi:MAG: TIGR02206 family membrane protein [Ruminococcaceae bacterium]|nr:TIGR02206 family membrane protein [Oscillospiraceae bacterium]